MNKSQRIAVDINNPIQDKFLKIRLEQNIDFLELLTLNIKTKDIYRKFNSNYGVLVGRVIANNGIGVPNAKISIFIPLSEEDENNEEIRSAYPYKTPNDKNIDGKRYNLLSRVSEFDDLSGSFKPKQPFGSFPIKPEIVTNNTLLDVYKKYYKFSTVTNEFGDYMIFGAPVGLYTVHMSVDITDIGKYSMTPQQMVDNLGYPESYFIENNTKIKTSNDLDDLPNIETQDISVNIRPFWGNKENFEIGITRQDFRIRAELFNSFIVFGNVFTDDTNITWGQPPDFTIPENPDIEVIREYVRRLHIIYNESLAPPNKYDLIGVYVKKEFKIKEIIFTYDNNISETDVVENNVDSNNIIKLEEKEYTVNADDNGNFVLNILCNRRKIIYDDLGNEIVVDDTYPGGVFTQFRGFLILDVFDEEFDFNIQGAPSMNKFKTRIKIPQTTTDPPSGEFNDNPFGSFGFTEHSQTKVENWFKQSKLFEGGKTYAISKFNGMVRNIASWPDHLLQDPVDYEIEEGFLSGDEDPPIAYDNVNNLTLIDDAIVPGDPNNVGIIQTSNDEGGEIDNLQYSFPHNMEIDVGGVTKNFFGGNWLNFSIYLPNIIHYHLEMGGPPPKGYYNSTYFSSYRYNDYGRITTGENTKNNPFGFEDMENLVNLSSGKTVDTAKLLRCDLHWTDFVETPASDIRKILDKMKLDEIGNGFIDSEENNLKLSGIYRNGINIINETGDIFYDKTPCPFNGGRIPETQNPDPKTYFFTGKHNCLKFLEELGLIR